jgi:phosphoribosylanthranilate isomerase
MNRFKIKVCGITRIKDAQAAVKYGADIIGFIFYRKSPRYISTMQALEIINSIDPTVSTMGVFVNEPVDKIIPKAKKLRLDYIQLGGDETNRDIKKIKSAGFKVIKSFRLDKNYDITKLTNSAADIVHLDNADKGSYGGSGKQFDWNIKIPKSVSNIMIAGGIDSKNVVDCIKRFNPLIIDVNSGVETKPGLKSDTKLKQFFKVVNKIRYGK